MKNTKLASIEIWNDRFYTDAVLSFLDGIVARHYSHDPQRWKKLRYVVGEMLTERIEKAYPGQEGRLWVELGLTETYFEVSIKDEGFPEWEDFSYDENLLAEEDKAFRNYLLDTMVDEVGMECLGKQGQRLYVRQRILNPIEFKEPEPYQEAEVLDTNISIVEVCTEAQALEAIRCIYDAYGYAYGYERLYYMDSFMSLIQSGQLISFIAVNDHGQTAGHFALSFSDIYKGMPEISTVVIRKSFRKLGLFSVFMDHCYKVAKERGLRALMGQPVAFHPMSQKACIRAGYTATAILLSYLDPSMSKEYAGDERKDLFAAIKIVDPQAESSVYIPDELVSFAKKTYDSLGWRYEFLENIGPSDSSELTVEDNSAMKIKQILLQRSGEDIEKILRSNINSAIRKKIEMIELLISLSDPSCRHGYEAAKRQGFIFSGLMPGGENGDYILMQMLMGTQAAYDKLVAVDIFEELTADIAGYYERRENRT